LAAKRPVLVVRYLQPELDSKPAQR
jgi:hypothetical protein